MVQCCAIDQCTGQLLYHSILLVPLFHLRCLHLRPRLLLNTRQDCPGHQDFLAPHHRLVAAARLLLQQSHLRCHQHLHPKLKLCLDCHFTEPQTRDTTSTT